MTKKNYTRHQVRNIKIPRLSAFFHAGVAQSVEHQTSRNVATELSRQIKSAARIIKYKDCIAQCKCKKL